MATVPQIDPAAAFLLDMPWQNLFEPATALPTNDRFRCKACREVIPQREREAHHTRHVRQRNRQEAARKARIRKERAKRLAKARAMRSAA